LASVGGTLEFPPGVYVVTSVGLRPGVRYLGYGATIRRPAGQGKWVRTFDTAKPGYLWSSDDDSPLLTLEGLQFDGNLAEQGSYQKYELEQAHLLFLCADAKRSGRLCVRVSNCTFRNGVADAISVYTNVEAQIVNCTAIDCFRGGLTITGGFTRVQVANFLARGKRHATGVDVEVDGSGFGGTRQIELLLDNLSLPDGDFDIGVGDHSVVLGTNISARAPFNLYGGGTATLKFTNCVFGVGVFSGNGNRIVLPGHTTFSNCRFLVDGPSGE
jgi:hypothetical protein